MKAFRLLALLEANSITGPAKNLLQFAELARQGLVDTRVETSVAVFQRGAEPNIFLETARGASISAYAIPEAGRFDRSVLPQIAALIRKIQPDLIQSHAVKSHFLVRYGGLDRLAPWIAFHHGYTWPDTRARVYNQLDRWSLRTPRRLVTVSRPFADDLVSRGAPREKIDIVHNAVDPRWAAGARQPAAAAALRERLGIGPEKRVILIVGRLSREKDHATLLRAVKDLAAAHPGLAPHLLMVGDGPERARIEAAILELGLRGSVTLTGQTPKAEPYYGIADVCVLSSLSEGSPNALLEAMAARVPAVATEVGGIPEIVSHRQSAWLIPPRDGGAMVRALGAVLTDRTLAANLAAAAYRRILAHHTPEARARRLMEIYRGVLLT